MSGVNAVGEAVYILEMDNPLLFYLFIIIVCIGVIAFYFYRKEYGLIATFLISALFYYGNIFPLYSEAIMILSIALLILIYVGTDTISYKINDFINGLYLDYKYKRKKHR